MNSAISDARAAVAELRRTSAERAYRADRIAVLAAGIAECLDLSQEEIDLAALWGWRYGGWTSPFPGMAPLRLDVVSAVRWAMTLDDSPEVAAGLDDPEQRRRITRLLEQLTPFDAGP
ncbi:MAG: hypothetical protein ACK4XJ_07190 [Fimbriimonadaceae bacterium]